MVLPHAAGSNISNRGTIALPQNNNNGIVTGFDIRSRQAIVNLDGSGESVRVAVPIGQIVVPGQIAQITGSTTGGAFTGSFVFNTRRNRIAAGTNGTVNVGSNAASANTPASCDISQLAPTSPASNGGNEGDECPSGYVPNCGAPGTPEENQCFGCKPEEDEETEFEERPNIPGNPGDGCGGLNDSCDWYIVASEAAAVCPTQMINKGFATIDGVTRVLCCGGEDRPPGDGCSWQQLSCGLFYSPNPDDQFCEVNPTCGADGRRVYDSLSDCEADLPTPGLCETLYKMFLKFQSGPFPAVEPEGDWFFDGPVTNIRVEETGGVAGRPIVFYDRPGFGTDFIASTGVGFSPGAVPFALTEQGPLLRVDGLPDNCMLMP
ncbi:hypothetical protein AHIS1_p094 [Acaryochloris phage A-HIS1]|nr:hypothetical protein AHIS1_p094 [Acaryochloris phage A-HIS1]